MKRRRELLWVMGILVLALALRLFAVTAREGGAWSVGACGEPFVQEIESILRSGNPLHLEVFFYPPAPAIIVAAVTGLWTIVGGGDVAVHCRVVTLAFSVATVGIVYMLGRFWGRSHAFIAMMLYAVTMIAVVVQGNVQVYSAFFVSLALYSVLRADAEGRIGSLAFAGVWLGLGVASKYVPIFFAGMLFAPYVLGWLRTGSAVGDRGAEAAYAEGGEAAARIWTGSLWLLVALAAAVVWAGTVEREGTYALLRRLYEQRAHENAFEHHLEWINRLYRAGLATVGIVGMAGALALLIPWLLHIPAWRWARLVYTRNRLWIVPCATLILTVAVILGLPVALNLQDFARHFVFVAKASATGDSGFFPAGRPAVSYMFGFIPENTGRALFIAGLVGLIYAAVRRDMRAAIIIASAIPAYVLLELSRVKVNRYALDLMPVWCVLAAVWLGDLCEKRFRVWRLAGISMVIATVVYSLAYSLAWAEFASPRGDIRKEAGWWLDNTIPRGASLGVKSALLLNGSPELLPGTGFLAGYRLVDYSDESDYVLLPDGVYAIVKQYLEATRQGYVYGADDWWPYSPSAEDLDTLSRIVREDGYVLVKEFRKRPIVLGLEARSDSLSGRTWWVEHGPVGIRVYRRVSEQG